MGAFQYTGRDVQGRTVRGRLEAADADTVANQLINRGITPIDITTAGVRNDFFEGVSRFLTEGSIGLDDLIFFSRQMYTLQRAGVPILQALRGLRDSARNPALGNVMNGIAEALDGGADLTGALRRYPKVFPPLFVSLVQVGETTGSLDDAFLQLSDYLEQEKETRQRVKSAVRYPIFVLAALAVAMLIINIYVIPAFAKVYAGFGADLPWATVAIIATSNFTVKYWPLLLGGIAAALLLWTAYLHTEPGRYNWDRYKLKVPVVGDILYRAALGRFGRGMGMTLKAGVPLVQGMAVISRAVANEYIGRRILDMRSGIERGESVTRTAAGTGLFPAIVLQMIAVGEETGALDALMSEVAGYYEREVDYALKNLSASIEPFLILAIGVLVLILALGVFVPMWDLATTMTR